MLRRILTVVMLSVVSLCAVAFGSTQTPGSYSVYYDVVGLTTTAIPQSLAATITGTGVSGIDLSRGVGIHPAGLTNGFSADGWDKAQTRDEALAAGAYYQFGLTVQTGFSASLSTIDMALRRSGVTAPMNMELQVSLDGFQTPGILISQFNYYGRTSGTALNPDPLLSDPYYYMSNDLPGQPNKTDSPGNPIRTIELKGVEKLQNVPAGTVVTFRLYAWGNGAVTATNTFAFGRMVGPKIEGTIATK